MARRSRGFVQLEWVCPNCSTRNPGPKKTCINCGAPQPENVQFERAAEEKLVTDAEALKSRTGRRGLHVPVLRDTQQRDREGLCSMRGRPG